MSAILSTCGLYRVRLERTLANPGGPVIGLFMVNPSTADATVNDQTIMKGIGFGNRMAASRLVVGNKFGFRAKDIRALRTAVDPVGPDNDRHLEDIMREADIHIVAWGPMAKLPKPLRGRWREVVAIADRIGCKLHCWGTAADGHPRHPQMLAYATPLVPWSPPCAS